MGHKPARNGGFSLVEVLAASVLLTLLLAVVYPLVQAGWRHWYHTGVATELRSAANLVMSAVESDLLRAAVMDGRAAVDVSDHRLQIVTAWREASTPSGVVPEHVIVYTFVQDGLTRQTSLYRYAGPASGVVRGMRLAGKDVDFTGSAFQRQSHRRVLVKLQLQKRHQTVYTVASYRYGYGFLPQAGE